MELIRLKTFGPCLGEGHGFGSFSSNGTVIEVDRVVVFVFQSYDNYRIVRHFFINRYVNTQEECDKKEAYHYHNNYFVCFSHFLLHLSSFSEIGVR